MISFEGWYPLLFELIYSTNFLGAPTMYSAWFKHFDALKSGPEMMSDTIGEKQGDITDKRIRTVSYSLENWAMGMKRSWFLTPSLMFN